MIKTNPQIDIMVKRIEKLIALLPPITGHAGMLNWIISDLQSFKSGKRPEMRSVEDWIYGNETRLNRVITNHETYLLLINRMAKDEIIFSFDEFGSIDAQAGALLNKFNIPEQSFSDSVCMRMYNDRILETVIPGKFKVIPREKWTNSPQTHWSVCNDCHRATYNTPCDFCGCESISRIIVGEK